MPASAEAAVVFGLTIAPGYLLITGYRRGRAHSLPQRDLYVLAQAVVASLLLLVVAWLVLVATGDPVKDWGLLPHDARELGTHRTAAALLLLVPFALGTVSGIALRALQAFDEDDPGPMIRLLKRTGLLEPPTAWDAAWNRATALTGDDEYFDVLIELTNGTTIDASYSTDAMADLSPRPDRNVFVTTGIGATQTLGGASGPRLDGPQGVFVNSSQIAAVYFTAPATPPPAPPGAQP